MSNEPRTTVDALLGRLDRVRSLARRLVRDAAEADDLVQEAVAAALSRPGSVQGEGDGWIAATLRNLVRDRARRAGRRAHRETAAARPEGDGQDTRVLVENAERQRDIVEAVLSLEDPYRETLLMRFFEDLPPREIVKRTGRSPETVKKHIARGIAQLRARLEKRYGGGGAWAVALLPMIGRDGLGTLGTGAAASTSVLRAAAVLLVTVGVGVPAYLVWRGAGDASGSAGSTEVARTLPAVSAPVLTAVGALDEGRAAAADAVEVDHVPHGDSRPAAAPTPRAKSRRIQLVGLDGAPLAKAAVEWTWAPGLENEFGEQVHVVSVETDAEGRATVSGPTFPSLSKGPWSVNGRGLAVAGEHHSGGEVLLVLAPSIRLAGRVVDPGGRPFEGADVVVWADPRAIAGFSLAVGRTPSSRQIRGVTGADGTFSFDAVPTDPAFRVSVDAEGRYGTSAPLPPVDELGLELTVGKPVPAGRWMTGTVLEASGAPAAGAKVRFVYYDDVADEQGRFRLQVPYDPADEVVTAETEDGRFVAGPSPVKSDKIQETDRDGVVEDAIILRLPASMPSLRGRLVDAGGEPAAGYDVFVFNGTRVGSSSAYFETGGFGGRIQTDAEGRFRIEHAVDRPYTLRFLEGESMLVHDAEGLEPGPNEHTVVLPADGRLELLRGHVVDVFGEPVKGAQISLRADLNPSTDSMVSHRSGHTTTTDAEGRFTVENAPWRHLSIIVNPRPGIGYAGVATPIGDRRPESTIELEVELTGLVHVSVDRADVERIEAYDESGVRLKVTMHESGATTAHRRVGRTKAGTFPLFEVSQRAVTFVLHGKSGELDRIPVRLDPSVQNELAL